MREWERDSESVSVKERDLKVALKPMLKASIDTITEFILIEYA